MHLANTVTLRGFCCFIEGHKNRVTQLQGYCHCVSAFMISSMSFLTQKQIKLIRFYSFCIITQKHAAVGKHIHTS